MTVDVVPSTYPKLTCRTCGDVERVLAGGRGFPPEVARKRLAARCRSAGYCCTPVYTAGVRVGYGRSTRG